MAALFDRIRRAVEDEHRPEIEAEARRRVAQSEARTRAQKLREQRRQRVEREWAEETERLRKPLVKRYGQVAKKVDPRHSYDWVRVELRDAGNQPHRADFACTSLRAAQGTAAVVRTLLAADVRLVRNPGGRASLLADLPDYELAGVDANPAEIRNTLARLAEKAGVPIEDPSRAQAGRAAPVA